MSQSLPSNLARRPWLIKWTVGSTLGVGGTLTDLGFTDEVDPSKLKQIFEIIKTGTTGKAPLGKRHLGLEGGIGIKLRECNLALATIMAPWGTAVAGGAANSLEITPAVNIDMYIYSAPIVLYPADLFAAGDHTFDLTLTHASPGTLPNTMKRDGMKDDEWEVMFDVWPDRLKLPQLKYGFIGATSY